MELPGKDVRGELEPSEDSREWTCLEKGTSHRLHNMSAGISKLYHDGKAFKERI